MLKYKFTAKFNDGTVYQQNDIDVSPNDCTRNCFYDVLQLQKEKELSHFSITDGNCSYTVDFERNGLQLQNAWLPAPNGLTNFRLIFFKRVTVLFSNFAETGQGVEFHLGWQANDSSGNNIQDIAEIT
jgi:hypothetical protein